MTGSFGGYVLEQSWSDHAHAVLVGLAAFAHYLSDELC